jgi:trans-aconitate 2-methyltransferase
MEKEETNNIAKWYDEFSKTQEEEGINLRNEKIQEWLVKFGLKEDSKILEIGCGIGTQTQLLAQYISEKGSILSNDISEKSIELARKRLNKYNNVKFLAGDIVKQKIQEKFDIVLLPDVLEHIPIKDHLELFKKIRSVITDDGFILIHIPNPNYLQWCHENTPELLQVLDQPIYSDTLIENVYKNDFFMHYLKTYSIWIDNNDYQVIVLKPNVKRNYKVVSQKKHFVDKLKHKISNFKGK